MTFRDRRIWTILGLTCALCVTGSMAVRAQETFGSLAGACPDKNAAFVDPMNRPHWNGWGVDASQHRFQPAEMSGLAVKDVPRLELKWAFGFPGAVRAIAQPTVVGGRLFVGSQGGKVYSLDAAKGCVYWEYDAGKPVRTAVAIGPRAGGWAAYFGDGGARVHAVDAATGKLLWQTPIDDHPAARITGSPTLVGATLFVPVSSFEAGTAANPSYSCCSFRGSLVALDASTGRILWKSYTIPQAPEPRAVSSSGVTLMGPSGAAVWSAPTFDAARRRVYVTTGDNHSDPPTDTSDAILAFDPDTGAMVWSRQMTSGDAYNNACVLAARANCPAASGPDYDFGSSAVLVDLADGNRLLIGAQKSGVVTALDPDRAGEIVWKKTVANGGKLGGVQWGVAADESNLYVAVSDVKVGIAAAGSPGTQPIGNNRSLGFLLDGKTGGGLLALKLDTGDEIWRTPHPGCGGVPGCSPAQSAAVTAIPGVVFSGGLDGRLLAYSTEDGRILWNVDTKGEVATVNGVAAHGGSIDVAGPVVVDGMLYVSSGSGFIGTMPGNVLLAYSLDGR
ncbi:MAG TPA: PQQ-binding-like beta-propeller repeat protein [Roseiarcus sp.]